MKNEDQNWLDCRARFADVYDGWNLSSPMQSTIMQASHQLAEKKFQNRDYFPKVLEIGAGTGKHLASVRHKYDHVRLMAMVFVLVPLSRFFIWRMFPAAMIVGVTLNVHT